MLALLFIIFGLKTTEKDYGSAYPTFCTHCKNDVYYNTYKWRRWFHIFWIPLIPWFSHKEMVCPICGLRVELSRSEFKHAKRLAAAADNMRGETEFTDEFHEVLGDFENELSDGEGEEPALESSDATDAEFVEREA